MSISMAQRANLRKNSIEINKLQRWKWEERVTDAAKD